MRLASLYMYSLYAYYTRIHIHQIDCTCTYIRARHPRTRAPCIAPCSPFVGCRTTPHRCRPGPHAPRADNSCWGGRGRGGGRGGEAAGVASVSVCEQWAVLRHAPRCIFSKYVAICRAVCCVARMCVAVCCSVLQCVAVCCSVLQCVLLACQLAT